MKKNSNNSPIRGYGKKHQAGFGRVDFHQKRVAEKRKTRILIIIVAMVVTFLLCLTLFGGDISMPGGVLK